jgi:hypothetical protein
VCVCVKTGYSWDVLSNQSCAKPKSDIFLPSPVHIKQTHNHGFRWCLIWTGEGILLMGYEQFTNGIYNCFNQSYTHMKSELKIWCKYCIFKSKKSIYLSIYIHHVYFLYKGMSWYNMGYENGKLISYTNRYIYITNSVIFGCLKLGYVLEVTYCENYDSLTSGNPLRQIHTVKPSKPSSKYFRGTPMMEESWKMFLGLFKIWGCMIKPTSNIMVICIYNGSRIESNRSSLDVTDMINNM